MADEERNKRHGTYTQYKEDLRDPKKFTAIFLGSKYRNKFPDEDMFYAMAVEEWRGYVSIHIISYKSDDVDVKKRRVFMITDTEIKELEAPNFSWRPAIFYTDTHRKINEEHGGYADCNVISTTNISDILKRKDTE